MSDVAIAAEGLGKAYTIGHAARPRETTLRDHLARGAARFARSLADMAAGRALVAGDATETFWALKDVSFTVRRGDVVGVIGRNGAGKSTLLKVLSRITEPTRGRVTIAGRVASLLEVGTGFHSELSGRENIFLNGAILGMTRAEIRRRFDAIVDFAGVERFIDTPVKRYSSGMYVRLAFSVAAHLEPDILIVDEVLAVGDAEFQRKCLGKMQDVAGNGRTVLFVSHNMAAVERLCSSALVLDAGEVVIATPDVAAGVQVYLGRGAEDGALWQGSAPRSPRWVRFTSLEARQGTAGGAQFRNDQPITLEISGEILEESPALMFGVTVYSDTDDLLFRSFTTDVEEDNWPARRQGRFTVRTEIPEHLLNEGTYRVELVAAIHSATWILAPRQSDAAITFAVSGGLSRSPLWLSRRPGILAPVLPWITPTGGAAAQ